MSLNSEVVNFEAVWSVLTRTVESLITLQHVDLHVWIDHYSRIYALCVASPQPLGDRLFQETKDYLNQHVQNLYQLIVSSQEGLLLAYHKYWTEYRQGINYLNKLYMYLNAQRVRNKQFNNASLRNGEAEMAEEILKIGELGLDHWKRNVIEVLKDKLVHLLLDGIRSDRLGDSPNLPVFYGTIQSFVLVEEYKEKGSLELYQRIFEALYLKATGDYYSSEASHLLQENCCSQYMEKVLQKLNDENLRSCKYLHPSSYSKVTEECEQQMVANHLQFFLGECKAVVQKEYHQDLQNLYLLLKSNPSGIEALIKVVQTHIIKSGLETVTTFRRNKCLEAHMVLSIDYQAACFLGVNLASCQLASSPASFLLHAKSLRSHNFLLPSTSQNSQLFVESFLDVYGRYRNIVKDIFLEDWQFVRAFDKACSDIINHKENPNLKCSSPELLAKYCDSLLKQKSKTSSESEVDDKLSQCIIIFKYIDDKDIFQDLYANMLAIRLISDQSVLMNLEEAMFNKLKLGGRYEFIFKVSCMFTDMKIRAYLNAEFAQYLRDENTDLGVGFSISVLKTSAWPFKVTAVSPCLLPQELEKSVKKFEDFYNTKFCGRKLTWLHHLCIVQLKLCYLKKTYFVTMNLYQAAILLLYETSDVLSYTYLKENTKLNDVQLKKQIQNLLNSKLLLAESAEEISPKSSFILNKNYSNKRTRFKLTVQGKITQQQIEQTHASVDEDRKDCLQAAIVRIMKARKILLHNDLIPEVIKQVENRFIPSIPMIKQCIKYVIDKKYIRKTSNSTDEYSYVA